MEKLVAGKGQGPALGRRPTNLRLAGLSAVLAPKKTLKPMVNEL